MKNLIIVLLLSYINYGAIFGQNYISLWDVSGLDINQNDLDSLEAAATALKSSFPESLQSSFKVFDAGYYHYSSNYINSNNLDSLWNKAIDKIQNSYSTIDYYLLFGREIYSNGKISHKVKVVLPETDIFYCIDNISAGFRSEIENQVRATANNSLNLHNYQFNQIKAIKQLKYIIQNKICCDPEGSGLRSSSCDACMINQNEIHFDEQGRKIYPAFDEYTRLDQNDFVIEAIKIMNDAEYFIPEDNSAFQGYENKGSRSAFPVDATIQFRDNVIATVDELIDTVINATTSFNLYTYKFPRDCGSFEKIWEDYSNDSGPAIFIALINVDRSNGLLAYHMKCFGTAGKSQRGSRTPGAGNPTEEDLEGMREALNETGSTCYKTLLAYGEKFDYNVSKFIGDIVGSKEQIKLWESEYKERENRVTSNLNAAQTEYGFYYDIEFKIQKRKYNRWDWTASTIAHYNMCAEVVHGVLDMCGVIEPLGIVCDSTNAVIYYLKGDYKNGNLSLTAIIPVAGTFATGTKVVTKIAKTAAGSPAGVVYRAVIKPGTNLLHWIGGRGKLPLVMAKAGGTPAFCKISDALNSSVREIHHLIPWKFTDYKNTTGAYIDQLNKKLDAAEWHPSNPAMNGFDIPKYLRDGSTFHGSHAAYSDWIEDALKKINTSGSTGAPLKQKMDDLAVFLRNEITKAYGNGIPKSTSGGTAKSLHEHFQSVSPY